MAVPLENTFSVFFAAVITFWSKAYEYIYVCNLWIIFNLKSILLTVDFLSVPAGRNTDVQWPRFYRRAVDNTLGLTEIGGTSVPEWPCGRAVLLVKTSGCYIRNTCLSLSHCIFKSLCYIASLLLPLKYSKI